MAFSRLFGPHPKTVKKKTPGDTIYMYITSQTALLDTMRHNAMPHAVPSSQRLPRGPFTKLHAAAHDGLADLTEALLVEGFIDIIDQPADGGWTPLMHSARHGHARVTEILLQKEANTSVVADGDVTALHLAAFNGTPKW